MSVFRPERKSWRSRLIGVFGKGTDDSRYQLALSWCDRRRHCLEAVSLSPGDSPCPAVRRRATLPLTRSANFFVSPWGAVRSPGGTVRSPWGTDEISPGAVRSPRGAVASPWVVERDRRGFSRSRRVLEPSLRGAGRPSPGSPGDPRGFHAALPGRSGFLPSGADFSPLSAAALDP